MAAEKKSPAKKKAAAPAKKQAKRLHAGVAARHLSPRRGA